jgi:uncharacterized membrane protein
MKIIIQSYITSGIIFLALDAVWLSIMGNALYRPQLGNLMLDKFLIAPAIAFYVIYPVGIAVFAIAPALQAASSTAALGYGALFGLLAYATYNLTNLATLRGWSMLVTGADITWGSIASGAAAVAGYWVIRILGNA